MRPLTALDVYTVGICCMSVCAPEEMSIAGIEAEANAQHPTGIVSPWRISMDEKFANDQPNPCPCEQSPGRLHYLLNC